LLHCLTFLKKLSALSHLSYFNVVLSSTEEKFTVM
jgi:hypothetical protein